MHQQQERQDFAVEIGILYIWDIDSQLVLYWQATTRHICLNRTNEIRLKKIILNLKTKGFNFISNEMYLNHNKLIEQLADFSVFLYTKYKLDYNRYLEAIERTIELCTKIFKTNLKFKRKN